MQFKDRVQVKSPGSYYTDIVTRPTGYPGPHRPSLGKFYTVKHILTCRWSLALVFHREMPERTAGWGKG